ncbi:PI-PLC domain-containing protein [Saccharopolyspora karakumensis]|uniref:hypothetical protein n=1 Tax=Saccharopolyspora karakumensis TaxID=2530386 RepID=UPI0026AD5AA0
MRSLSRFLLPALAALTLVAPVAADAAPAADVAPLAQAHAHNDYLHERPLLDALDHGFTSVEADIYPLGDSLLIGHDPFQLNPDRTIESLYLDPLVERLNAGGGSIYPGHDTDFQLLVDFRPSARTATSGSTRSCATPSTRACSPTTRTAPSPKGR